MPTTQLQVEFPNGANLLPGNEVREGGFRIGDRRRHEAACGCPTARSAPIVKLKIDKKQARSRSTRRFTIRPRSVLGLKYVELNARHEPRRCSRTAPRCRSSQARFPVELDEFFNIFDERHARGRAEEPRGLRRRVRHARRRRSTATIRSAPRFLAHLEPVMATLSPTRTRSSSASSASSATPRASLRAGRRPLRARLHRRRATPSRRGRATRERAARRRSRSPAPTMERRHPLAAASSARSSSTLRDFSVALDDAAQRAAAHAAARSSRRCETGIPVLKPLAGDQRRAARRRSPRSRSSMATPGTGYALRGLGATVDIAQPAAALPRARTSRSATTSTTAGRNVGRAPHRARPDRRRRSARCSTRRGQQSTRPTASAPASIGAATPANGEPSSSSAPQSPAHQHLLRGGRPRRATPTASPASAATSSA